MQQNCEMQSKLTILEFRPLPRRALLINDKLTKTAVHVHNLLHITLHKTTSAQTNVLFPSNQISAVQREM